MAEMRGLMPDVIDEIRELLNGDALLRDIIVLEKSTYEYHYPEPHGRFANNTHADATRKFQILESHGLVRKISSICYQLSPRFVRMLKEKS